MSYNLRHFLFNAYEDHHTSAFRRKLTADMPVQIDDQDDSDKINEFCNIFCTVKNNESFCIELIGNFLVTPEINDLIEIYNGQNDISHGRLQLELNIGQIDVLIDLAEKIRKTSFLGVDNNPHWLTISARTISSLFRFVRIIKEYKNITKKSFFSKIAALQSVLR